MDLMTILKNTDPDRYETARRMIADRQLTVLDLHHAETSLAGTVESKKVKIYKRKPTQIDRKVYQVRLNGWERSCSCPDWEYRGTGTQHASSNQITTCKHMLALVAWAIAQQKIRQEQAA